MLYETLSDALDVARRELDNEKIMLAEDFDTPFKCGMKYGEVIKSNTEILKIKGKATKKYFHVIITRMETGRYELVCYTS